jgi:hypothetical protein
MEYSVKPTASGSSEIPEIKMVVTEFKREAIAAAKFETPKDFQKQAVPTFEVKAGPAETPKKAPAKKAAKKTGK